LELLDDSEVFAEALTARTTQAQVLVLDTDLQAFTRMWVLFEVLRGHQAGIPLQISPPDLLAQSRLSESSIELTRAHCTDARDEAYIRREISKVGIKNVNSTVREAVVRALADLVSTAEMEHGETDPATVRSRSNLAVVLAKQGKYKEAEMEHRLALQIQLNEEVREHQAQEQALQVAMTRNNLGTVLRAQGKYSDAEVHHRRALAIRERHLGKEHPDVATSHNNLGGVLSDQGKYLPAMKHLRQALEQRLCDPSMGENDPHVATSRSNLALVLWKLGRDADAEKEHRLALAIRRSRLGEEHPDVATSYSNLGTVLYAQKRYPEAEKQYRLALRIRVEQLGEQHPKVASSRGNLGQVLHVQKRHTEAEKEHRMALEIREAQLGPRHPDVATSYDHLARVLFAQRRNEEAAVADLRALEIRAAQLGDDHPLVAVSHTHLGMIRQAQGQLCEAEARHRRALEIRYKHVGEDHPHSKASKAYLVDVLAKQGKAFKNEGLPTGTSNAMRADGQWYLRARAALEAVLGQLGGSGTDKAEDAMRPQLPEKGFDARMAFAPPEAQRQLSGSSDMKRVITSESDDVDLGTEEEVEAGMALQRLRSRVSISSTSDATPTPHRSVHSMEPCESLGCVEMDMYSEQHWRSSGAGNSENMHGGLLPAVRVDSHATSGITRSESSSSMEDFGADESEEPEVVRCDSIEEACVGSQSLALAFALRKPQVREVKTANTLADGSLDLDNPNDVSDYMEHIRQKVQVALDTLLHEADGSEDSGFSPHSISSASMRPTCSVSADGHRTEPTQEAPSSGYRRPTTQRLGSNARHSSLDEANNVQPNARTGSNVRHASAGARTAAPASGACPKRGAFGGGHHRARSTGDVPVVEPTSRMPATGTRQESFPTPSAVSAPPRGASGSLPRSETDCKRNSIASPPPCERQPAPRPGRDAPVAAAGSRTKSASAGAKTTLTVPPPLPTEGNSSVRETPPASPARVPPSPNRSPRPPHDAVGKTPLTRSSHRPSPKR